MTTPKTKPGPAARREPSGPAASVMHTAAGVYPLDVRLANTFLKRLLGLMFSKPLHSTQGLLLTHCASVHGAFLRGAIDVVYLDRDGIVTKCVAGLRPWRASISNVGRDAQGRRYTRAAHTLELAAGTIAALGILVGDRLQHPYLERREQAKPGTGGQQQRGSAMIEFTIVGPIITLLGLGILQYGMLFFARSQINYAGFMAAREAATLNADLDNAYFAYVRALVPLYGGGQKPDELAISLGKAVADIGPNGAGNINLEQLNPTKESFDDWNDPALQAALHTGGKRVIPNGGQAFKSQAIGATSGQTIQDANLFKLRITHGYLPKIPLIKNVYSLYLKWQDPHTSAFYTKLVTDGRIPVVTSITLHMQSDAIEPAAPVSSPGPGNNGAPVNPAPPPITQNPPPECPNIGCTTSPIPTPVPICNPATDPAHCAISCTPSVENCCPPS
ncbi:DUF192 domain-containing protein [Rugamonas sp. CCM 8940]|uniref:DUF192 domain-containing protein n=1 Tax=Rugamonas sp. CCM 8940 TaxID=2765359 RepID=UPI0018F4F16F|nr:DUF192 domain-containing protein [Rugamonas sp. CCM 8940]MBJ7311287.1 DUF192 domain-containing protein [Rugamonas sp. CCM 8940]